MEILLTFIVIISILLVTIIILFINLKKLKKLLEQKNTQYSTLLSQKKSSEVRIGQIAEHLVPFLGDFKYDPKNVKFLGQPIDLICFEHDKIIFIEVKTGKSQLSSKQKNIKELIENNKVYWEEFRISPPDENQQKSE